MQDSNVVKKLGISCPGYFFCLFHFQGRCVLNLYFQSHSVFCFLELILRFFFWSVESFFLFLWRFHVFLRSFLLWTVINGHLINARASLSGNAASLDTSLTVCLTLNPLGGHYGPRRLDPIIGPNIVQLCSGLHIIFAPRTWPPLHVAAHGTFSWTWSFRIWLYQTFWPLRPFFAG